MTDNDADNGCPAPYAEDKVPGSTDDDRPGADTHPGDEESRIPAGLCSSCGRTLAGDNCRHCAVEDEFGEAALVRRFVSYPDLYSDDSSSGLPECGPGEWPAPGDHPPAQVPDPADDKQAAVPAAYRERFDATPYRDRFDAASKLTPERRTRHPLDPAGWGPRGILAKVVIAGGSILLAAVVGIASAVVTGPADTPTLSATPSRATAPGPASTPPALSPRAVTGAVIQGEFCLDDYASGTNNGNAIQMWQCSNSEAQRWTFATDATVRMFGRCMRPVGGASAYGTKIELWECDRTPSQHWLRGRDGSLVHPASGACLEDPALSDTYGSRPQLAACSNGPSQQWNLP